MEDLTEREKDQLLIALAKSGLLKFSGDELCTFAEELANRGICKNVGWTGVYDSDKTTFILK
ncbi:hypothetical protein COM38_26915 [Bacillus toyonensis]|uniref:hypothetical protein n=1 Tax=Bacillus toyonensis TaxID=155322 RepID=UPI000BEC40A8|nr:hypothetical protein [Bacillus toyonensis]PEC07532.1 hypothetical protein CON55_28625 [Bacillus toyonensis]PGD49324.1 hypothetical protein COM38_26915 [Bacillus toyonensis]